MITMNRRSIEVPTNLLSFISHSAKGSSWKDHKYIKRKDGTYYYPDSYEGGRHLDSDTSKSSEKSGDEEKDDTTGALETTADLSQEDIDRLAKEVIRGNFDNGQIRKELLGEAYQKIQNRVNEILRGSASNTKVSDAKQSDINATEKAVENVQKGSNPYETTIVKNNKSKTASGGIGKTIGTAISKARR